MQTSVNLQEPFSYSIIPVIIMIFLFIIINLVFLKKKKNKIMTNQKEIKVIPEKNKRNIPVIKNKYLQQLNEIETEYENNKIELRKAYQLISELIRMFIFEVTDITTQNYSLKEIKKLKIPNLYELIEEYYEPEFANKSVGDFKISANKARRVIEKWK